MEFKKHAFILEVIEGLHRQGSWTGKTHVQKALSLLRDKGEVNVPFGFVLYRHGPYSFDIQAELDEMRSYGAIEVEPNMQGYGVVLRSGNMAEFVKKQTLLNHMEIKAIEDVCAFVDGRNVIELERIATASWIRKQEHYKTPEEVVNRLVQLKPHVPKSDAEKADNQVANWLASGK
jgi:hypothetical protein